MNARGTRRPHARTPRSRDVNISRRGGGDDGGGKSFVRELFGCLLLIVVVGAIPVALLGALDVIGR